MSIIVGIDQGSSHTWAAASDLQGNILSVGRSFGACHAFDGIEKAMQAVNLSCEAALQLASIPRTKIQLIYSGMTGADWQDEFTLLHDSIVALNFCQQIFISNDSIIALRGGTYKPYGLIMIAGTGGNVAIRSPQGQEFIYGYYHDMELQGGGALGWRALTAVLRAHTFREPSTLLTARILEHFKFNSVEQLCRSHYQGGWQDLHQLAPLIFECAYEGDEVAARIIVNFGRGYVELATALLQHFGMCNLPIEIVLSGSIFKGKGPLLLDTIAAGIHFYAPKACLVNARYEPVVGAVLLGLEKAGVEINASIQANIEASAQAHGLIRTTNQD